MDPSLIETQSPGIFAGSLPFQLQAKSEFEFVGQKPLGDGLVSVPVKEFRAAVVRSTKISGSRWA